MITAALLALLTAAPSAAAQPASADPPTVEEPGGITVTGSRPSRLREMDQSEYRPISGSGMAAMAGSGGIDPFKTDRRVRVRSFAVTGARLSRPAAERLAQVQRLANVQDYDLAREQLRLFEGQAGLTPEERFVGLRYALRIAEGDEDVAARESVLGRMLATDFLTREERQSALRTTASLALRRGDEALALARYLQLRREAPTDALSRANLAALYQRRGENGKSVAMMREAVSVARQAGQPVPESWLAYVR